MNGAAQPYRPGRPPTVGGPDLDGMDLVATIQELRHLRGSLGMRALTIKNAEERRRAAKRALAQAEARVRVAQPPRTTIPARQDAVILDPECQRLQQDLDVAEAAESYAKRLAESDKQDVSAQQSIASLIKVAMQLAGMPTPGAA